MLDLDADELLALWQSSSLAVRANVMANRTLLGVFALH